MINIPIILGSSKDIEYANTIVRKLSICDIKCSIRICSAHKNPIRLMSILDEYENEGNIPVIVVIAGKSNALGAVCDGYSSIPIINAPPLKNDNMYDLYSSISMPSDISPMFVLNNIYIAVLKICGLTDSKYKDIINRIHLNNKNKLRIEDIKQRYLEEFIIDESEDMNDIKQNANILNLFNDEANNIHVIKQGKIRDIIAVSPEIIGLHATNRLSGFDRQLTTIPFKGQVINSISNWWFKNTRHIVPNHILCGDYNGFSTVKKCNVFPIEFVMRSYMTGSTNTSIWCNYKSGVRSYCGIDLREGYVKNDKLDNILLTPTTKSDVHDELISEEDIINYNIMSAEDLAICKDYAFKMFKFGQETVLEKGLILVDTKYEFGKDLNGNIMIIDELHTPDSSRYWIAHDYEERHKKGLEPNNIDKEFIRRWVKEKYGDPYSNDIKIEISDELRYKLSKIYLMLEELITKE